MDVDVEEDNQVEEYYVFSEFDSEMDIEQFRSIHVLGMDKSNPVIQMDDSFFTGKYQRPLGTYMFFVEDPSPECLDPVFDKLPDKNVKYLCKANKYMKMAPAYVSAKDCTEIVNEDQKHENDNIEIPNFKSIQEAQEMFKKVFTKSEIKSETGEMKIDCEDK